MAKKPAKGSKGAAKKAKKPVKVKDLPAGKAAGKVKGGVLDSFLKLSSPTLSTSLTSTRTLSSTDLLHK